MIKNPRPTIDKICPMCGVNFGKEKPISLAIRMKCCSRRCNMALKTDLRNRGPAVIKLRLKGYSWVKIAEILKIGKMQAYLAPKQWDRITRQDHSALYTDMQGKANPTDMDGL